MMKKSFAIVLLPLVLALAACSEKPQTASGALPDHAAYRGTGSNFMAPGWTAGDRNSWEQHMKARTQRGQNEFNRLVTAQ